MLYSRNLQAIIIMIKFFFAEYEDEQTNGEMKEIQFETVAIVEDWNIEIRKRSNSEDFETDETLKKMCFSESDC